MARPVKTEQGKGNVEWTKQQLIHAAAEQFSKFGFEGASLSKIREKVGVKNSTILYHFKSKAGLYLAVTEHLESSFASTLSELINSNEHLTALERLGVFCKTLQSWGIEHQNFTAIIIQEMMNKELHSANSLFYQNIGALFQQVIAFIKGDESEDVWLDVNWQVCIVNIIFSILVGQAVSVAIPMAMGIDEAEYRTQQLDEIIRNQTLAMVRNRETALEFLRE
ncbi:TetR/AcrR family transcriptional regulator [Thalassotalea fonticola]|uniref:TetR/AcrR family transcriptional regulator n=1 Tax=Thalassotalea fonticola TaxID=3065649 RepID=A0ABZ0GSL5_9GAMM|nr:TetR/AcrR family transcriptional regulator [Colwelliaceae bacterium S1-1]